MTETIERPPWYPYGDFDAKHWAEEFDRIFPDRRPDTDTMLGWFANAIMTGYDKAAALVRTPETHVHEFVNVVRDGQVVDNPCACGKRPIDLLGERVIVRTPETLDVEGVMEWLRRSDSRLEDIFGLWVQGKRDDRWVAEKLISEGHLAALAESDR